ncbi:S41 family peptidase [Cellulomonas sp. URHD0024]|uniref:S41 family peptidase n=1 Tax=Cellulomonas sp. URHD0024 TaxID=1302620 RepID=UPI000425A7D9|nr:S41 family peptidase [Cellulomonas sp. URHD0024]
MNELPEMTRQARRGRPLRQVPGLADDRSEPPVELTVPQRHDLVDLWSRLLTDVYVHYDQKKALYGYDPVRALLALRRQIPYLGPAEFLRELTLAINRLRDQHTQLYVRGTDLRRPSLVATLPFLVEVYGDYRTPTYVVTKVSEPCDGFAPGVRVTTWNGVPFSRAVDLYADTLTGGRPDARRARALETMTQRPLGFLPRPDELWVDIGYRDPAAGDAADRTIRFEWHAIAPATASTAPDAVELRTRRAVDSTSETARRARKLLFQPGLWQQDLAGPDLVARASSWMPTALPDAISAREVPTSHGVVGYLRLWTFDVGHSDEFLDEIDRVVRALPSRGLIIDVRSNPGGVIEVAERLLQLFTTKTVEPVRFALRATATIAALADADGNGADLADWAASVRTAIDLGEVYSQHLPISDPERCNGRPVAYRGPVVVVVDPTTFSSGDIFTAGIADHGIGQVVSIGAATGAGGANVWTHDDIEYAHHVAGVPLPPRPPGIGYSIAVRRAARSGTAAGLAIEDVGVPGEEPYTMTERDVLDGNHDLIEFCARLLTTM